MNKNKDNQTDSAAEQDPPQHSPTPKVEHPDRLRLYKVCFAVSVVPFAMGGYIGLGSDHYILGLILIIFGSLLVTVGLILQALATQTDRKQKLALHPAVSKALAMLIFWSFLIFMAIYIAKIGYKAGLEQARVSFIPPTPTNATQSLSDGRILLTDVTPEYLDFLFLEHTTVEAVKLVEPYRDKWITFDGPVIDLTNGRDKTYSLLRIGRPEPFWSAGVTFTNATQIERLQPLSKGNPVKVLCKITVTVHSTVDMTDCELVNP